MFFQTDTTEVEPLYLALWNEKTENNLYRIGIKTGTKDGKLIDKLITSGLSQATISPKLTWLQKQYVGSFGSTGSSKSMLIGSTAAAAANRVLNRTKKCEAV